ncbi:MAG: flagellar motor switch protein FliN [Sphingomonadales bacterium]|nr:flagellar motor switch protein FliN [Sphingomonadales bacterium]
MADDENIEDGLEAEAGADDAATDTGAEDAASADMEFEEIKQEAETSPFDGDDDSHSATELEPVFDVPVNVQVVLGKSYLEVSQLLKLGPGAVVELDRKVGEAIDIYVNDRLVARGEVILLDENLGVTMTEIIKGDRI